MLKGEWFPDSSGRLPEGNGCATSEVTLQGNLDSAVLLAGPEATCQAPTEQIASMPPKGHLINLGQGLTTETPIASVEAMVGAVHSEVVAA